MSVGNARIAAPTSGSGGEGVVAPFGGQRPDARTPGTFGRGTVGSPEPQTHEGVPDHQVQDPFVVRVVPATPC